MITQNKNTGVVVDRIMPPHHTHTNTRCPYHNLQNLLLCYLTWQKDFAEVRDLEMEKESNYVAGVQCDHEDIY